MSGETNGSPGSHPYADRRNWQPAETIEDYFHNVEEGLEENSDRCAAKLIGESRPALAIDGNHPAREEGRPPGAGVGDGTRLYRGFRKKTGANGWAVWVPEGHLIVVETLSRRAVRLTSTSSIALDAFVPDGPVGGNGPATASASPILTCGRKQTGSCCRTDTALPVGTGKKSTSRLPLSGYLAGTAAADHISYAPA